MFYSESLLSKTGPLARVWLASNLDRKLTKQNVLASNLENNVKDIIGHGQAPMALRLSSQLLLGVVKIYNRKARYLMDDCSDALLKIKMAFRPGNVDLPSDQSHRANPNTLMLADTITELDLLAPLPDPDELLRAPTTRALGHDPTLLEFETSQLLPDSQTPRATERRLMLDDIDLDLDIGLEPEDRAVPSPFSEGRSVEVGRRAQTPRADESTMLYADDLGLYTGVDDNTTLRPIDDGDDGPLVGDDDVQMGGVDDEDDIAAANAAALARADAATQRRLRDSESPLSSVRSSVERDLETTFQLDQTNVQEDEAASLIQAPQRVKRRKVMRMDNETEMHNSQIKKLQEDRSAIIKAPSFLPRDPVLLQLMEMQRNGSFVSTLMGNGLMQGLAPELRGIMSLELVRQAGDKKRKRDSGIADVEIDAERLESPQLEIPQDEDEGFQIGVSDQDTTLPTNIPLIAVDDTVLRDEDYDEMYVASPGDGGGGATFDVTEAPLLHPSQSGPVALGTKKMVHMLREYFAPDHPASSRDPPTPSKRVAASALFTDLCPEARTSRQDATKMFFELLVLGTKDAIKVEQDNSADSQLGGPLRVRGKRGLWGDWAEMGTGATQEVSGEGGEDGGAALAAGVLEA